MDMDFDAFRGLIRHDFQDKYYGKQESQPKYFGKWPKLIGY
jgi:hypothetical protein